MEEYAINIEENDLLSIVQLYNEDKRKQFSIARHHDDYRLYDSEAEEEGTTLDDYKSKFCKLTCASNGMSKAPHKAILLIAVMRGIVTGKINSNLVTPSPELVELFEDTWEKLVPDYFGWSCTFHLPFYHMSKEPFWKLMKSSEYVHRQSYAFGGLRKCFEGAVISKPLFTFMSKADSRMALTKTLIEKYELKKIIEK